MGNEICGFDYAKIIAASLIVLHHYQQVFECTFDGINFYGGRIIFGYFVELFFTISGFLTLYAEQKRTAVWGGQRLIHKLLRLYPMVFLSILVCLLLKTGLSIVTSDGQLADLWAGKTLLVNFGLLFAGYPYLEMMGINNPVWYVCVLIQCYLLFYLIEWGLSKLAVEKRSRWRLYIYMAVVCIALVTFRLRIFNEGSFRGIASFSIGVLLCMAHQTYKLEDIFRKKWIAIGLMALAVTFLKQRWVLQFFLFPAAVFGLSYLAIPKNKLASRLGDISFDLYVIHYPLMVLVKLVLAMTGGELIHSYGTMGVFLVASWCIAGLMWRYIDLPSRAFAKRIEMKFCK